MLSILAVALAMLGYAHLLAVRRFNERFLSYALAQHQDPTLRGPTLQEILSADKAIWTTISGLVRDHDWSLTDAMNEVGFCRQDVSALLQPRPRAASSAPPKRPEPKRTANSDKAEASSGNPAKKSKKDSEDKKKPLLRKLMTNPGLKKLTARRSACVLSWVVAKTRNADSSMAARSSIVTASLVAKTIPLLRIKRLPID